MIKRFEQYITEATKFSYTDYIQSLIDKYEDDIQIKTLEDALNNGSQYVDFIFKETTKHNISEVKEYSKLYSEFINDLETVIDTMTGDGLTVDIGSPSNNPNKIFMGIKNWNPDIFK